MTVLAPGLVACDSPEASEPAGAGRAGAWSIDHAAIDWREVATVTEEEAQALLFGLVRILDLELSAASGTARLSWAPQGAIVSDSAAVEVAWFFSAGEPRHRDVSPELWKTAAEYVASRRDGLMTKAMPETVFSDGRGAARNTVWTFTRGEGAQPELVVEWWTR